MTQWSTADNDEFEFYDEPAVASDDSSSVQADDDDGLAPGATSDKTGSVHVWFDEASHLSAIRVSNRWRERLKGDDTPGLAEVVRQLVCGRPALPQLQWMPKATMHPPAPLSSAALDRLLERSITASEKAKEMAGRDVRPRKLVGQEVTGHSANRQASVTIAVNGRPSDLTLDDGWIAQARAADIGEAVQQAYDDARQQWQPPTVEPGEWDLLTAERHDIRDEALALLKHGI